MRRVSGVVGLVLVGLLGSGCAVVPGTAGPAPTAAPAGPTTTPEPTGIVLPPRPRDVPIDGIEPCSLLTAEQLVALELDGRKRSSTNPSVLYGGQQTADCSIVGFEPRAVGAGLSLVPGTGIELWTSGQLDADLTPTTVSGFPALVAVPRRFTDFCTVIIDVAPGQLIDVQFSVSGFQEPTIAQPQLCRDAERVADAVATTLLAR